MKRICILGLIMMFSRQAFTAVTLFDFESNEDLAVWKVDRKTTDSLKLSTNYVTSGRHSLELRAPPGVWWAMFDTAPSVKDWSGYDRLVVDITNPNADATVLVAYIGEALGGYTRSVSWMYGFKCSFNLPARGSRRYVVDITGLGRSVVVANISNIHLACEDVSKDLHLYLDNFTLLRPGEKLPPLPGDFTKQTSDYIKQTLKAVEKVVARCESEMRDHDDSGLVAIRAQLAKLKTAAGNRDTALEMLAGFEKSVDGIIMECGRMQSLAKLKAANQKLGVPTSSMLVGFANSMQNIMPKDLPFDLEVARTVNLSAARNEKEAFQIAVTPAGKEPLRGVTVSVSALHTADGRIFYQSNINCDVVGYVCTKRPSPFPNVYVGWWPDFILNFL